MKDFHKLKVWEKAHDLTLKVYLRSQDFPKEEIYGLTSQMRRSSASVPTNIAEGCGRSSKAETIQFFNVATGSASELEYQLILAHDLHYLDDQSYIELTGELIEVRRMLYAFIQRLKMDLS
jgi:four helix bundle protein